jgi:hypothetical protein
MKLIVSLFLVSAVLLASCSTNKVLVESNLPNQIRLTSQTVGCKLHKSAIVGYGAWGAWGIKSTANLVEGARGPVRIEFKNTPGTWLLNTAMIIFTTGFVRFKQLEVYECVE